MSFSPKIEVISNLAILGEGPHWNVETQDLLYVDIPGKSVHRYDPKTKEDFELIIDEGRVSLIVPVEGQKGKYIIGVERELYLLEWDGRSKVRSGFKKLTTVDEHEKDNRFNDGKCDPQGRLWAGTMGHETKPGDFALNRGSLFSLDLEGKVKAHEDKISISNGLCWSSDSKKFYFVDSLKYKVQVYDFDAASGSISNCQTLFDFKKEGVEGIPDGMTIDAAGNLWLAVFTGSTILHIDGKSGKLIDQIKMPALKPTSVAFGGPNLDVMYVTSAKFGLTKEELAKQPENGALFKITNTGAKGPSGGVSYKGKL